MSRTEHYWYGRTHVAVIGDHVMTTLPDGAVVNAVANHTDEDVARAEALGYEGDVVAMTRDHDRFHAALAHALGLPESPALRAAVTGRSTAASGADEDMVLAAQRMVNLVRAGR